MSTDSETMVLVGDPRLESGELQTLRELVASGATVIAWQHSTIVQDRFPSPDVASALERHAIEHRTIAEAFGADEDFDIDEAVIAWFKNYGRDHFKRSFRYGRLVLWWWAELYLYHQTPLRLAVRDVEALARLIAQRQPKRVLVVRPPRALDSAARAFASRVETVGQPVSGPPAFWRTSFLHVMDLVKMWGTGVKSIFRARPAPDDVGVLFLTHASMWRGDREMYFDRILPAVRDVASVSVVAFGPPEPFKKRSAASSAKDRLELGDDALPYRPIRRYFTFGMSVKLARAFGACRRMWRSFRSDARLEHRGVALGSEALACFRDTFYRQLPWAIRAYHEVERVIETDRPDVLVLYAESSGLGRAAIAAARTHGVATFAVQHGIMYRQYYSHEHAAFEVGPDADSVPLPTRTAVFGSLAKDLLVTRGSYDPGRIFITGSPKFDDLVRAAQGFDRAATRASLSVPSGERFVVLATRWSAVGDVFRELVEAAEAVDGLWLFIKPHQAESTAPYDAVIEDLSPTRCRVLPASMNLLELLFASDGLVTVDSFASSEALVLGRPVLVVNLPSNLDALVERGVALGVTGGDSIEAALRSLLFDEKTARELEKKRKVFIQEFAFGADGRSTERIVKEISRTKAGGA